MDDNDPHSQHNLTEKLVNNGGHQNGTAKTSADENHDNKHDEEQKHEVADDHTGEADGETLSTSSSESYIERQHWGSQMEFTLAIVGYSVAFGNLMRFPYLCMRNGGGAFLLPFFLFTIVCAFPLYYMEVCLGQFSGSSPLFVWRLAPLLRGLGWLMILISGVVSWYYNTIIAWVLYYLVNSFSSTLPWSTCDNAWNTPYCRPSDPAAYAQMLREQNASYRYGSASQMTTEFPASGNSSLGGFGGNVSDTGVTINSIADTEVIVRNISSAKEFWLYNVLAMSDGIDDVGSIQIHLVVALFGAWVLVFLCLIKGVSSVGKVVYVTALLPYVLLVAFLIRGLTLPGAMNGVAFYVTTDFNKLRDAQVWLEAAVQVFYSLGPTWGGVITMASYNKFHNNSLRDSIIACLADSLTSFFAGFVVFAVVGYMAQELNQPIETVATAGPGMMFIAYPEAISRMPLSQLWAVLFFIMMIAVGLDTQFGMFETLSSGIVDAFPRQLSKRKTWVTAAVASVMFLLGLIFTTNAGIFVYNLIDWYCSAFCMCLGGALELLAIAWYYGAERFSEDMKHMFGYGAPTILRVCWCITSPAIMIIILLLIIAGYKDVTYEGYIYPDYAVTIGYVVAMIPIIPLPVCFIYGILTTRGSLRQRFSRLMKPSNWRPSERKLWSEYENKEQPTAHSAMDYIKMNLCGRRSRSYTLTSMEA